MIAPEVRSAVVSLQGRRPGNEDAVLSARLSDGRHLCAVADGMGGHRCGEVASALALESLRSALDAGAALREAMEAANLAVHAESAANPERAGMGTTLVALLRAGASYEVANVGDSRAYRVDRTGIRQITVDHSFAAEAARSGMLSPTEVERSPWRNALTRSLGTQSSVEVDVFGPFPGDPAHLVLLCSDGLYRALPDEGLREHLLAGHALEAAVGSLAELAVRRGSDDNVTVAVMAFGSVPETAPRPSRPPRATESAAARSRAPALPLLAPSLAPHGRREGRWVRGRSRSRRSRRGLRAMLRERNLFLLCVVALLLWFVSLLAQR